MHGMLVNFMLWHLVVEEQEKDIFYPLVDMRCDRLVSWQPSFREKRVLYAPFGRTVNIATAGLMELIAKITGWDPPFTIGLAKEYSHRYARFDNSKIIRDFNYTFYSLEDTIRDAIRWFSFIGKIELNKNILSQFQPEAFFQ